MASWRGVCEGAHRDTNCETWFAIGRDCCRLCNSGMQPRGAVALAPALPQFAMLQKLWYGVPVRGWRRERVDDDDDRGDTLV